MIISISEGRKLRWSVSSFLADQSVQTVIQEWLSQELISVSHRVLFQVYIDILESGGPLLLPGCIFPVSEEEGFYAMNIRPKRQKPVTPVFCYGPVDAQSEITFLVGAPREGGILQAQDVLPIARHNLQLLLQNPKRRRRERID